MDLSRRKPKLLIIGHAGHGKDTLAKKIRDKMGLGFTSSSAFVGRECIWKQWGRQRYLTFADMFADRVNHRKTWADLISAYNTPDKTRTARTMLKNGYDMYVGMRRRNEFNACHDDELFDRVIWVDALKRLPPESEDSMELSAYDADLCCDNNGSLDDMDSFVDSLQRFLHCCGYSVGLDVGSKGTLHIELANGSTISSARLNTGVLSRTQLENGQTRVELANGFVVDLPPANTGIVYADFPE